MLEDLIKQIQSIDILNEYAIEIGIISGKSKERQTVSIGITNAELMFIHENGSPVNNIPARPVIKMTIEHVKENLLPNFLKKATKGILSGWSLEEFEKELGRLCMRIQTYAQEIIYSNDGRLAPNAPSVANAKGGNYPLHDTGQLARSISCQYIRI